LDYQIYFEKGQRIHSDDDAYTSHNTKRLDELEVMELVSQLPEFKLYMNDYKA
jgi:hypothetical protein